MTQHRDSHPPTPWGREKLLALLIGAGIVIALLAVGLASAFYYELSPSASHVAGDRTASASHSPVATTAQQDSAQPSSTTAEDALAARMMPVVDDEASHPAPVSVADPGQPIPLPTPTTVGPAEVASGFPHTNEGALAQLAAIDQSALQAASLAGARAVITGWAEPGGPNATTWSGVKAVATFLTAAGLSGGGSAQLAIVVTPLMGLVKGAIGPDFVIPCVDFEVDVTLTETTRGAVADCQRMVWSGMRWGIGRGAEPADPPSVWPDTDIALSVGYRDLRQETVHD